MAPPILPIGLLLGKADTAFKFVGGSSIVFNLIRSRIFGKVLRAIEYPDGELHHVKIYRSNLYGLKSLIADTQPPPYPTAFVEPEDIKQVSVFTSPHFTEPVTTDSDVSSLPENAWLLWSKDTMEEDPIPTRGVKLDGSHIGSGGKEKLKEDPSVVEQRLQDEAIKMASKILQTQQLSRWQFDRIIDMAVDRDSSLMAITRNFKGSKSEFQTHCVRLLRRRNPKSILLADSGQQEQSDTDGSDSDDDSQKRSLEPQVELSSRE